MGRLHLVCEDLDAMVLAVESIDILESSARRFPIEERYNGNEGGVEDDPDDVELHQRPSPDGHDLNDHVVGG